ncbi:LysR family transcriptional regulator [Rhodobacter sp. NTK016B]|uniref:LysR family transcriptional regulator n=1 Tax=Rhodobacter sp. NTK016B TaxID=2759676 RepID=UPI001A8C2950|nr:LysR family transcriptional regulator [Rhodobacter sp. NTK016B]MBN8290641.1 LysR family transcriptional regulator [Rhodobacter sp. NTK016B]
MSFSHRHLTAFVTVSALHSLGRAAEQMHITQPALSRIIRNLEETLGVRLFERHPLGMTLTAHGQAFLPRAELLLADWSAAIEEQRHISALTTGTLRIGCVAGAVKPHLNRALQIMLKRHPGLRIIATEAIEDKLTDALVAGQIDLAVAGEIEGWARYGLRQSYYASDSWNLFVAPDHPLCALTKPSLSDLLTYRWVMVPEDSIARDHLRAVFGTQSLPPPDCVMQTRSITVAAATLVGSDYITMMPDSLLESEVALGRLVKLPFEPLAWHRALFLYRRDKGSLSPAAREFIAIMAETGEARPGA